MASLIADPEQDKWLDDANDNVQKQGWMMKLALDKNNLNDALKCASKMTDELRTSKLSPKNYYELYMNVCNQMRSLEDHFELEDAKDTAGDGGKSVVELYESVQHAGNVIPRLYLLITVASVYIKSKKAPAKDILFDLVELCRGVQHPMRGLFLRNYLSQMSKDKLPDTGSEYDGIGGTIRDAIEFVLQNFGEMNKLWVRMQHQGAVRDKSRREKERRNLRQLVGTNLVRLSEMRGVDVDMYRETVLPRILEQVINCKDVIAQEYLMDCVIQVFPDDFHLVTLEIFLNTCTQLQEKVNVKNILVTMMNRLSQYVFENRDMVPPELDLFPLFLKYSNKIMANPAATMTMEDTLQLQVALMKFALKVYPDRIEFVDGVLGSSVAVLEKSGENTFDNTCVKLVIEMLSVPLDTLALQILQLQNYSPLMNFLALQQKKAVSTNVASAVVKSRSRLDTVEKVAALFSILLPLIKDDSNGEAKIPDEERFDFEREQNLIARVLLLINSESTDISYQLLVTVKKFVGQGGPSRDCFSMPPLVFTAFTLVRQIFAKEQAGEQPGVKSKKVFGFIHETIQTLQKSYPELALRLFLMAAQSADDCNYEAISYEFVVKAFEVYEEEFTDSKAQLMAINYIVAFIQNYGNMGPENYDTIVSKATQHCGKLLKKTDQCRAVLNCAHMFWPGTDAKPGHRDEKRVLVCLQRALKIANTCLGHQAHLFVEILNKYLYFFDRGCPSITVKYLTGLIALIEENIRGLDESEGSKVAQAHYDNTIAHIRIKQQVSEDSTRYAELQVANIQPSLPRP